MATNALSFLLRLLAGAASGGCGCGCGCRHTDQDVEVTGTEVCSLELGLAY
uniref:Uncharacterized protein n=1 Tax=Oryza sativa subsp. japonica TaxID=39947 RepID=Q337X3_ORYSJ|nr:hypothetical protein LOC_Os10g29630 [Oryza sativa Japonica Group]